MDDFLPPSRTISAELPADAVLAILSDTHVTGRGTRRIPDEVFHLLKRFRVTTILHAGDLNAPGVLEELEDIAPVIAVHGNSDTTELRRELPGRVNLTLGTKRLALIHGHAGPTADRTAEELCGTVDAVIYGHSHIPRLEVVRGTMLFNPGSPTDKRWWPDYSFGILKLANGEFDPALIVFKDPRDLDRIAPERD